MHIFVVIIFWVGFRKSTGPQTKKGWQPLVYSAICRSLQHKLKIFSTVLKFRVHALRHKYTTIKARNNIYFIFKTFFRLAGKRYIRSLTQNTQINVPQCLIRF